MEDYQEGGPERRVMEVEFAEEEPTLLSTEKNLSTMLEPQSFVVWSLILQVFKLHYMEFNLTFSLSELSPQTI